MQRLAMFLWIALSGVPVTDPAPVVGVIDPGV